jgi:hypothetical protein
MTSPSEAHQKALAARETMLDARPKDTTPPLPDKLIPDQANCQHYFESARRHYLVAANAYAAGDMVLGSMYEVWAYQFMVLGQACEAQIA